MKNKKLKETFVLALIIFSALMLALGGGNGWINFIFIVIGFVCSFSSGVFAQILDSKK